MKYLKGLNALRFFAAMLVLVFHCNDAMRQVDPALKLDWPILKKGPQAVDFFFILSGFLLTYKALAELHHTGQFKVKAFFIRRIFRILPLYYLAAFLGLVIIGIIFPRIYGTQVFDFSMTEGFLYYLFLIPNYVAAKFQNVGPLRNLWSIGVEEQFYLIFPMLILAFAKLKRYIFPFISLLIAFAAFYFAVKNGIIATGLTTKKLIVETLRFHFILLGCVAGSIFWFFQKHRFIDIISASWVQGLIWISFIILLCFPKPWDPHNIIAGILFTLIMINCSADRSIINLEIKLLAYLGVISYGIYIFHPFVSIGIRFIMQRSELINDLIIAWPLMFYCLVSLFTFGMAHISFKYFESYFLKQKIKFQTT